MKILAAVSVMAALTLAGCAASSNQAKGGPARPAVSDEQARPQACVRDLDCGAGEVCYQGTCHH